MRHLRIRSLLARRAEDDGRLALRIRIGPFLDLKQLLLRLDCLRNLIDFVKI